MKGQIFNIDVQGPTMEVAMNTVILLPLVHMNQIKNNTKRMSLTR